MSPSRFPGVIVFNPGSTFKIFFLFQIFDPVGQLGHDVIVIQLSFVGAFILSRVPRRSTGRPRYDEGYYYWHGRFHRARLLVACLTLVREQDNSSLILGFVAYNVTLL
jgi:hypothetical protein